MEIEKTTLSPINIDLDFQEVRLSNLIEQLEKGNVLFENKGKNIQLSNRILKKSRIIETLLLKIPLSNINLDYMSNGKLRPIDTFGYDLLYSLNDFILQKFPLQDLEFMPNLKGKFNDLDEHNKRTIFWKVVNVCYLNEWIPPLEKYALIERMSIGNKLLTAEDLKPDLIQWYEDFKSPLKNIHFVSKKEQNIFITSFIALFQKYYSNPQISFDYFKNFTLLSVNKAQIQDILPKFSESLCYIQRLADVERISLNWVLGLCIKWAKGTDSQREYMKKNLKELLEKALSTPKSGIYDILTFINQTIN